MPEQEQPRHDEMPAVPVVPEFREGPNGGLAFGATQEPEFATDGPPDGRESAPDETRATDDHPALGAVTQDDPMPAGHFTYPDDGAEGQLTLVAVFEDITGAKACADDLDRRFPGAVEIGLVSRRGDGPEQGPQPGNVITGPGYGLSAEDESPPKDPEMGSGVTIGATLGATAGLLAATYVIPPFGVLVATGSLISTLAGAGIGSFLGGLFEFGASEQQDGDDATMYPGQVRRGGVILLARTDDAHADEVRKLIDIWRPLEIRVQ